MIMNTINRYTFESDGYYAVSDDHCTDDQNHDYYGEAIERLAEYENIGLLPSEIKKLIGVE